MVRRKLSYGDYRPLVKGELGYSPTARRVVSNRTGEILSRRQFVKLASGEVPPTPSKRNSPRKPRIDKGLTRAEYKRLKEESRQKIDFERALSQDRRNRFERINRKRSDSQDKYSDRFQKAKTTWNIKHNRNIADVPKDDAFYEMYDMIQYPDNYEWDAVQDSYDYFYEEESGEYEYDYPLGETP